MGLAADHQSVCIFRAQPCRKGLKYGVRFLLALPTVLQSITCKIGYKDLPPGRYAKDGTGRDFRSNSRPNTEKLENCPFPLKSSGGR